MTRWQIQEGISPNFDCSLYDLTLSVPMTVSSAQCLGSFRSKGHRCHPCLVAEGCHRLYPWSSKAAGGSTDSRQNDLMSELLWRMSICCVWRGDWALLTKLSEQYLGTRSGQWCRDPCLCDEGTTLARAWMGRCLLSRCQQSLWPGRLDSISSNTDVSGGMEPFPSTMTVAQVELKWRWGELRGELFHIWLRELQINWV